MRKPMFVLLALAISLFGTQCWATTQFCSGDSEVLHCTNTFSPGNTEGVYDFTGTGDGRLVVDFVTVRTTFTLTVAVNHTIDPLDPHVFPEGTVCVKYESNGSQCDEYDFTGSAGGPNGVPVKNKDYKGLITLTLSYFTSSSQMIHNPAFGHAPETNDTTTYNENILTGYSKFPISDPTMTGSLPGLSSVAAFDEPGENDSFCFVSPHDGDSFSVGQEIEVAFRLTRPGTDCLREDPIRDKDARLSLSTTDSQGNVVFPPLRKKEEGNKFHFDHEDGVNELDLSTKGLAPGNYTITVFSDEFSPQSVNIILTPRTDDDVPD